MLKHSLLYVIIVSLLTIFFTLVLWLINSIVEKDTTVVSPVPSFLSTVSNSQVRILDLWIPLFGKSEGSTGSVDLTASSALTYDLQSNTVLFEKSPRSRLPMASLTKIMTAIVSLENPKENDRYTVREEHLVGENSMGVTPGEVLSLEELLYGLMLPSGNDAAEVLAGNFKGGRDSFIDAMNEKASALGLDDTHFTNPSGLQGDGLQYTTAYDLLVITRYALEHYPKFKEVVSTFEYTIPQSPSHKAFFLQNETNLLTSYPGVKGIKTGFTPEAGLCLVTYLEYKDRKIVGVILNSQNRRQEMKDLLDFSLHTLGIPPPSHS